MAKKTWLNPTQNKCSFSVVGINVKNVNITNYMSIKRLQTCRLLYYIIYAWTLCPGGMGLILVAFMIIATGDSKQLHMSSLYYSKVISPYSHMHSVCMIEILIDRLRSRERAKGGSTLITAWIKIFFFKGTAYEIASLATLATFQYTPLSELP